ncbi:hypothetical protein [Bradyrhizobium uaiense]|uniref:Uncharacterized protein n=1 Tax=Bradyrhizobium uaiense TaxID=2594946 RepID=A0A6P1BWC8_9BRAD|nr:hypothetical protein [Bradyrhizobium uaiense]NEV02599.1 hypothetical protein [Bradyrhizobium uaiense]
MNSGTFWSLRTIQGNIELTALGERMLANEAVIARDGKEALDYVYCRVLEAQRTESDAGY